MKENNLLSSALRTNSEQPVDPHPRFFTITPKTIRLSGGSEIFPLRNVTRVGKYKIAEKQFPVIAIIFFAGISISGFLIQESAGMAAGVIFAFAAIYGIIKRMKPKTFAFGFECASGASRYLTTTDEKFIDKILLIVSQYMESDQEATLQINVQDRSITNLGTIVGDLKTGG